MNNAIVCAICGRVFETAGFRTVCPDCFERDMKVFDTIRDYLYVHPRAKVFEVSTNLDIPVPTIKRYLREGRLEIIEKENYFLRCEKCGKPICSGTLCDDCQKQATHELQSSFAGSISGKFRIAYLPSAKK